MNRTGSPTHPLPHGFGVQRTTQTGPQTASSAAVFDKVLRAFETGGFTYADTLEELKLLLATGASPTELLDILRRRELIEPLPEYARAEVLGILDEAIERVAAEPAAAAEAAAAEAPASAEAQNADADTAPDQMTGADSAPTPSMTPPVEATE